MVSEDRALWFVVRRALLMIVDAIERRIGVSPRTAELRKVCEAHRLAPVLDDIPGIGV